MLWSYIKDRTGFLPKKYKYAKLEFDKVNTGSTSIPERSKTCANAVLDIMPYAVGRLYVKNNFDQKSKEDVNFSYYYNLNVNTPQTQNIVIMIICECLQCILLILN